jgi:hypothetical protein
MSLYFLLSCNKTDKKADLSKIYFAKDAVLKDIVVYYINQFMFGRREYVGNFSKDESSSTEKNLIQNLSQYLKTATQNIYKLT